MILLLLARFWPYIAIAVLTLGLYASVKHSGSLSAQLDTAIDIANNNAKIIDQERADHKRAEDIVAKSSQAAERSRQSHALNRRIIINAPLSDDGPLAPVLRRALDGLPEQARHSG